jgi:dephospho-CoA kinase
LVSRHFATWGAAVIDADAVVRELQQPGSPVLGAIVDRFGPELLQPDGSLNRIALRRRVMGDADALAALNAIVHPAVAARRRELLEEAERRGAGIVVSEIPLLFEVLDPDEFDVVVLVHAPEDTRRRRLIDVRGIHPDDADRLLASQLDAESKRQRSDIVIDNDGTVGELKCRAREAWNALQVQAARNLRGGHGC